MSLPSRPNVHPLKSLIAGITLAAVAVIARWALDPWLGETLTLVTVFPAVAIAVWIAGYRAAMITALAGFLMCDALFMEGPRWSARWLVSAAAFSFAIFFVIASGESMRRNRALAERRKNLLQVTLRSIGDAVVTTDATGAVTDLNEVASSLTGWTATEASGKHVTEVFRLIDETSRKPVPDPLTKALASNRVVGLANHTILISKVGNETAIDDSAAPIRDSDGSLIGGVLIFRDVEKRRAALLALQSSESRHLFLANLALETQRLSDPQEIMLATARMLARFLNADRCAYAEIEDEAVFNITGNYGPRLPSIVGRWDVAAFGPECVECMEAGRPFIVADVETDSRIEGHRAAYHATSIGSVICVPLHKDGKFTAAMAVHQQQPRAWGEDEVELVRTVVNRCWETLERARANRILTETADRLTLALAASQLGDWSWDANSDLVDLSPRAAEILGTAPETRMTWSELRAKLHPDDTIKAKLAVERAAETNTQYDIEYRVTRDVGVAWVSAKGRASYDSKGLVKGMFGVVQDITERKELEAELERKAAELAIADRQKDDFIALLAHELRNPLAPVRTGLELMRIPGREPGEQEKVRGMMERQLDHMVRLVDDLLDVSRITRNKLLLNSGPVILAEALNHALEMVSPMMEARNQTIRMDVHRGNTVLWADFNRLSQVFGNLLVNASKFSGRGAVIELRDEVGDDEIRVSITDPGVGIRKEDLSRIFSMFSQAERSISSSKGGLGLGLHLARALMELHGGAVVATSAGVGMGSTFTVSIPLPPANHRAPVSDPSSTAAPSPFKGMKVLVVDDNADVLESLSLLLTMAGAEVVSAGSGEEAIAQAAVFRPNLILMDVGMPRMDGLEATRRIRSLECGREPIVIALTGWGRTEDRKATDKAGCDGHLVKPVKFHELEALVHRHHSQRA